MLGVSGRVRKQGHKEPTAKKATCFDYLIKSSTEFLEVAKK